MVVDRASDIGGTTVGTIGVMLGQLVEFEIEEVDHVGVRTGDDQGAVERTRERSARVVRVTGSDQPIVEVAGLIDLLGPDHPGSQRDGRRFEHERSMGLVDARPDCAGAPPRRGMSMCRATTGSIISQRAQMGTSGR